MRNFQAQASRRATLAVLASLGLATVITTAPPGWADATPPGFAVLASRRPLPGLVFMDASQKNRTIAEFRGKVVLLNIWATWCVPCRHEMPSLDRLQAKLGGESFEVVAVSIDQGGLAAVEKFYDDLRITHLAKFVDSTGETASALGAPGLPTSLLVDRKGQEIGRVIGPAEWDSSAMVAYIQKIVAGD